MAAAESASIDRPEPGLFAEEYVRRASCPLPHCSTRPALSALATACAREFASSLLMICAT